MKLKWLNRRVAKPGPYLALCTTEAQFIQALKDCGVKERTAWVKNEGADATCHHLSNEKGEACAVVCIRAKADSTAIEIAGLIVHEAVHVWQEYCERMGETSPGREQEAYAIQGIAQELMWAYSETLK